MPSLFSKLASYLPGFKPGAMSSALVVESPQQRAERLVAEAKSQLERSRGRQAPSTPERIPNGYHGGIAGKVWFLPFQDSTTHDTAEIRAAMRLMRRDGYVKAAWEPQILTVASEDTQIQPSESGNSESEAQASFIGYALNDYHGGGIPQLVRSIVAPFGSDGHTVAEKVWEIAQRGRLQGKIICGATKAKDTSEGGTGVVRLQGDEFGNVTSVKSYRKQGQEWPISDFLYARYLTVFDEPLGEAAFRPAYGPYWMRDTVRKLRMIHHEKKMAGMLAGTYVDDDDKGPLEAALTRAKTSTWISIPEGCRIEAINLSTAAEPDYKSFDESLRDEIVIAIAFATLQQLVGSAVGGEVRGKADVQKMISDLGPWLLMAIVMDVVNNQLIPDLIDFNFPYPAGGGYPKLTFGAVSSKEILSQQQVVLGAMQTGIEPSKKYYAKSWSVQLADPNDPDDAMKLPGGAGAPTSPPGGGGMQFSERPRVRSTSDDIRAAVLRFASEFAKDRHGVSA
jgi:hypothetical protein